MLGILAGVASTVGPSAPGSSNGSLIGDGQSRDELTVGRAGNPRKSGRYSTTLIKGFTPSPIWFAGRQWRVNAGSTWNRNLDYPVRISSNRASIRFEVRDSEASRSKADRPGKRRAELSTSLYGDPTRLPNGKMLWGAYSFNHIPWSDPDGMRDLWGGVYGQIHMGSKFGGSPAFAVRRKSDGRLWITTRGEQDPKGSDRYLRPLSFGQRHDLVYAITLDPEKGNLRVWIDGQQVVNVANVSIGSSHAQSYWAFGLYFAGGVTGPVVAEYSNMVPPGPTPLHARIDAPPAWQ